MLVLLDVQNCSVKQNSSVISLTDPDPPTVSYISSFLSDQNEQVSWKRDHSPGCKATLIIVLYFQAFARFRTALIVYYAFKHLYDILWFMAFFLCKLKVISGRIHEMGGKFNMIQLCILFFLVFVLCFLFFVLNSKVILSCSLFIGKIYV